MTMSTSLRTLVSCLVLFILNTATMMSAYEYRINLTSTTEFTAIYESCIDWPDYVNREYFTYWGLRVMLPDDAKTLSGQYIPSAMKATEDEGLRQWYNDTNTEMSFLSFGFESSEGSPVIRLNTNDDPFFDSYQFSFVDDNKGKATKNFNVNCILEQTNISTTLSSGIDVRLTVTLEKMTDSNDSDDDIDSRAAITSFQAALLMLAVATVGVLIL